MDPLLVGASGAQVASQTGSLGSGSHLSGQTNEQMFQQYRGSIPVHHGHYHLTKADDPEHKKPVIRYTVHAKVFYLENTDEKASDGVVAYEQALQSIYDATDGAEMIVCEVKPPADGNDKWTVFLQWRTALILPASAQGTTQHRSVVQ